MSVGQNMAANADREQQKIIAQIQKILQDLQQCAPHPDKPDQTGPLFLQGSDYFKLPDENDSMLGAIAADQAIGSAFASVASASAANTFDTVTRVLDTASSVYGDRQQKPFQIGSKNMIAAHFNGHAKRSPEYQAMMQAYQRDLPQRLSLEKFLSHEMRRLYALQKHAHMYMAA